MHRHENLNSISLGTCIISFLWDFDTEKPADYDVLKSDAVWNKVIGNRQWSQGPCGERRAICKLYPRAINNIAPYIILEGCFFLNILSNRGTIFIFVNVLMMLSLSIIIGL
ncbi:hypothetical protein PAECIP111802_03345 [Paenibacillus allorhizosphaerae]|uniref:Uncharacterized protein n=1 Tax=Paenibacillus allorhizosphaerae TaxID=2849866 RepID=A0ABM8VJ05_9BACL|nr:hypothetical protein PAECIP111802_03345 [Paenibacillus allorhizosphaerae]